jgi:hypothetical protein
MYDCGVGGNDEKIGMTGGTKTEGGELYACGAGGSDGKAGMGGGIYDWEAGGNG